MSTGLNDKIMDKLADEMTNRKFIVKKYSVTTETNPNVSPYGAYGDIFLTDIPTGYEPVSCDLYGLGSTNVSACRLHPESGGTRPMAFVWTRTATTLDLYVICNKTS